MITPFQEYAEMYIHLFKAFGVGSRSWDEIHCHYSSYMYCEANRLNITGEYLVWKDFVEHAKQFDVPYYCGIDTFLREYEKAVMNRVKLQD